MVSALIVQVDWVCGAAEVRVGDWAGRREGTLKQAIKNKEKMARMTTIYTLFVNLL